MTANFHCKTTTEIVCKECSSYVVFKFIEKGDVCVFIGDECLNECLGQLKSAVAKLEQRQRDLEKGGADE